MTNQFKSSLKDLGRKVILVTGLTVVTLIGLEMLARLYFFRFVPFTLQDSAGVYWYTPEGLGDYQPSRSSIYISNPLSHYPGPMPYSIQTNSQGLRALRDYAIPKPPGVIRILCIGDSFTDGAFVHNFETYPFLLNARILKEPHFEVINAGRSGYSIPEELDYLLEKGLRLEPDVVVLQVLNNDLFDLYKMLIGQRSSFRPPTQRNWLKNRLAYWAFRHIALARLVYWQVLRQQWERALDRERLLQAVAGKGEYFSFIYERSDPSGLEMTFKAYEAQFSRFKDAVEASGARLIVVHPPDYMQVVDYNLPDYPQEFFRNLTAKYKVLYVDLLPVFRNYPVEPDFIYLMPENGHLSRLGNWIMAKEVGRAIREIGLQSTAQ